MVAPLAAAQQQQQQQQQQQHDTSVDDCVRVVRVGRRDSTLAVPRSMLDGGFAASLTTRRTRERDTQRLRAFRRHWAFIEGTFTATFRTMNDAVFGDVCRFVSASSRGDLLSLRLGVVPVAHLNVGVGFGDSSFWRDPLTATLRERCTPYVAQVSGAMQQSTKAFFETLMHTFGVTTASSAPGSGPGLEGGGSANAAKTTSATRSRPGTPSNPHIGGVRGCLLYTSDAADE